jgi:hypothetical protein
MAAYNLVIPDQLVTPFTEAFQEYIRKGGTDNFDSWAIKTLGQALLPYLQSAQTQRLLTAFSDAGLASGQN